MFNERIGLFSSIENWIKETQAKWRGTARRHKTRLGFVGQGRNHGASLIQHRTNSDAEFSDDRTRSP